MKEPKSGRMSENVFCDLELPDAAMHASKAGLAARIQDEIRTMDITQIEAANLLNLGEQELSRMLRGRFRDVSLERLFSFLTRLGCAIEIIVTPPSAKAFAPIRIAPKPVRPQEYS